MKDVIFLLVYHDCYVCCTNQFFCMTDCKCSLCRQKMQCYADYKNCGMRILIIYYANIVGNSFDVSFHRVLRKFANFFCLVLSTTSTTCILQIKVVNKAKSSTTISVSSKFLGASAFASNSYWATPIRGEKL